MIQSAPRVLVYRWIVFLLALGYTIHKVGFDDYTIFAGPFRFLTIWALLASTFLAGQMLRLSYGRSQKRLDGIVGFAAVLNMMVVILYWRLFLADPASVTSSGQMNFLYLEVYLHGLGPFLQWVDATFIHRSFTRIKRSLLMLFAFISVYILWIELVVQRFATFPSGEITNGLPYRFLNNLPLDGRANVYATYFAAALVLLLVFAGFAALVRRFQSQEAP